MNQEILSTRIVRRGNYFIRLDGLGWVLIDGPWFRYLSNLGRIHVRTVCFAEPFDPTPVDGDQPPQTTLLALDWEEVRWFPGSCVLPSEWKLCWNWWEYLSERCKFGWRTLPDGKLPAYLNRLEFGKNPQHDEEIRWLERQLV